ncbi:hypothetical protein [Streptomyces sp. NPDC048669]|uniref:hypothetical protein n=1 Tax=Streptomyces sp. NPDC048669 TaxID=3155267 RepID=UPI00344AF963
MDRFRPVCPPLPERVRRIVAATGNAARTSNQRIASIVCNQIALIFSDVGLPNLSDSVCRRQAMAYLNACPLPATSAISALTPVVNLARLRVRGGAPDEGLLQITSLYEAVENGRPALIAGITVPDSLVASPPDREEVLAWLRKTILADGSRIFTNSGRWSEARALVESHRGMNDRMLDGRQIAVLASLASGADSAARALVESTHPGEPWEQDVTSCLSALCSGTGHLPADHPVVLMAENMQHTEVTPGKAVFHARIGLTVLDICGTAYPVARLVLDDLDRWAATAVDGNVARECQAHHRFRELASTRQLQRCADTVRACGLGVGSMPSALQADLSDCLNTAIEVIRSNTLLPHA